MTHYVNHWTPAQKTSISRLMEKVAYDGVDMKSSIIIRVANTSNESEGFHDLYRSLNSN